MSNSVLAMYDVRGIQKYIFGTNKIKEIIGASVIVENIIMEGLKYAVSQREVLRKHALMDWEDEKSNPADAFINENSTVQMQVLFIGGGNAYVLFRDEDECRQVNRLVSRYVLDHTYSLNLAVAFVPKTDSYANDYKNVNNKMREIKAKMPDVKPLGAQPFMATDSITGYPLSGYDCSTETYLCTESLLKREAFQKNYPLENAEKILDNMVTEKGDNSFLAVVHIDGNNMGSRIKSIMEGKTGYKQAISAMRTISKNIRVAFTEAFNEAATAIDSITDKIRSGHEGKLYRKIILAGDDITFICNAKAALLAVQAFIENVVQKDMYQDNTLDAVENHLKYGFSACAGIAYFNSHFPFSDAYDVAETCCDKSAKKAAKKTDNRNGGVESGNTGCYVDFQVCTHIKASDLVAYRNRNYTAYGKSMIYRPYYIASHVEGAELDNRPENMAHSIENFWKILRHFQQKMTRSHAKTLRNAFAKGEDELNAYITFLESRSVKLPEENQGTQQEFRKIWYDALELMDICLAKEETEDEA